MIDSGRPHRKLGVWQYSMQLVKTVYDLTKGFPKVQTFVLSSQIQRAAISIPSNIAEGAARKSRNEFLHSLNIAQGSLSELDTQLELAYNLKYIDEAQHSKAMLELTSTFKMLSGLVKSLKAKEVRGGVK